MAVERSQLSSAVMKELEPLLPGDMVEAGEIMLEPGTQ